MLPVALVLCQILDELCRLLRFYTYVIPNFLNLDLTCLVLLWHLRQMVLPFFKSHSSLQFSASFKVVILLSANITENFFGEWSASKFPPLFSHI